jgi:hypothetical protein
MSNSLGTILTSIEEATPGTEWAAFYLSGGSDSFWGFRELDVCVNGEIGRRGTAKDSESDGPTGTDLENIVNASENQTAILDTIVPEGQALKCVDQGACGGILLAVTRRNSTERKIAIPLNWRGYDCGDHKWEFSVPANFRGLMIQYENIDDDEVKTEVS